MKMLQIILSVAQLIVSIIILVLFWQDRNK